MEQVKTNDFGIIYLTKREGAIIFPSWMAFPFASVLSYRSATTSSAFITLFPNTFSISSRSGRWEISVPRSLTHG